MTIKPGYYLPLNIIYLSMDNSGSDVILLSIFLRHHKYFSQAS